MRQTATALRRINQDAQQSYPVTYCVQFEREIRDKEKENIYDDDDVEFRHVKDTWEDTPKTMKTTATTTTENRASLTYRKTYWYLIAHSEKNRGKDKEKKRNETTAKYPTCVTTRNESKVFIFDCRFRSVTFCTTPSAYEYMYIYLYIYVRMSVQIKCFWDHATNLIYTPTILQLCQFCVSIT